MHTLARRTSPITVNSRARSGGEALRAAVGDAEAGAAVLGVSTRLMRAWLGGDESSPISRSLEVVDSVPNPAPLVVIHKVALIRRYLGMNTDALVAEFFDVLARATVAESMQVQAKVTAAQSHDLHQLRSVTVAEATLDEQLAAIVDRLIELRVNPWEHGRGQS